MATKLKSVFTPGSGTGAVRLFASIATDSQLIRVMREGGSVTHYTWKRTGWGRSPALGGEYPARGDWVRVARPRVCPSCARVHASLTQPGPRGGEAA